VLSLPQFTCFTSTKVQILTASGVGGAQFTTQFACFTSTKAQILTASGVGGGGRIPGGGYAKVLSLVLSLLALLVQKYKH
jgi:hypothetical protein